MFSFRRSDWILKLLVGWKFQLPIGTSSPHITKFLLESTLNCQADSGQLSKYDEPKGSTLVSFKINFLLGVLKNRLMMEQKFLTLPTTSIQQNHLRSGTIFGAVSKAEQKKAFNVWVATVQILSFTHLGSTKLSILPLIQLFRKWVSTQISSKVTRVLTIFWMLKIRDGESQKFLLVKKLRAVHLVIVSRSISTVHLSTWR